MENKLAILGIRIRNLRKNNNLTQKQLAEMIGLTPKMISFYENNERTPPLDILISISKIFQVNINYLLGFDDSNTSTNYEEIINWKKVTEIFPDAIQVSPEIKDLISYYERLSLEDKRWIMGQMIDLLRKSDIKSNPRKAQ